MNSTFLNALSDVMNKESNGAVYNPQPITNTQPVVNNTGNIPNQIIVSKKMLEAMEKSNGNGVIDPQKFNKVMVQLRLFEERHGMPAYGYILSGFTDINSFKVESVVIDSVSGTYKENKLVVAKVSGNDMEIVALIKGKVTL